MMIPTIVTILVLGLCVMGISIKIWAKKDGEFSGTCASQNPYLNQEGENCGFCGKSPDEFKECNGKINSFIKNLVLDYYLLELQLEFLILFNQPRLAQNLDLV